MNYIAEWLDSYHRFWVLRMERLEDYLRKLQEKTPAVTDEKLKNTSKVEPDDSKPDGKN